MLIALSPVAVGAGLFVPGFAALGLGAVLLLLPPRPQCERAEGTSSRVVRARAAAVGGAAIALARGVARTGARTLRAMELYAATEGRERVVRIGAATVAGADGLGRAGSAAASRGWTLVEIGAPRASHRLVATARVLARVARSAGVWLWRRSRPTRRRAWAVRLAAAMRAEGQLAALGRSASKRVSAYVDSRSPPR